MRLGVSKEKVVRSFPRFSGSMDPHIFPYPDPDPGRKNVADPTETLAIIIICEQIIFFFFLNLAVKLAVFLLRVKVK